MCATCHSTSCMTDMAPLQTSFSLEHTTLCLTPLSTWVLATMEQFVPLTMSCHGIACDIPTRATYAVYHL